MLRGARQVDTKGVGVLPSPRKLGTMGDCDGGDCMALLPCVFGDYNLQPIVGVFQNQKDGRGGGGELFFVHTCYLLFGVVWILKNL